MHVTRYTQRTMCRNINIQFKYLPNNTFIFIEMKIDMPSCQRSLYYRYHMLPMPNFPMTMCSHGSMMFIYSFHTDTTTPQRTLSKYTYPNILQSRKLWDVSMQIKSIRSDRM